MSSSHLITKQGLGDITKILYRNTWIHFHDAQYVTMDPNLLVF